MPVRVWVVAVVLALGAVARADETVTVTLSDAGPDRPVPIGSPFYLTGTVSDDVRSVQAVVVRYGHASLWPRHEPSCVELGVQLQSTAPSAGPLVLGSTHAKVAFPHAAQPSGDLAAYVTAAWARNALVGPQPYGVLVPNDTGFFEAGYQFCVFVVQGRVVVDDQAMKHVIEAHARQQQSCWAKEKCADDDSACHAKCLGPADAELAIAEDAVLATPNVRDVAGLRAQVGKALPLADQFEAGRRAFSQPAPWFQPSAGFARHEEWLPVDSDHFAMVLANRLTVTQNGLVPQVVRAPGGAAHIAKWTTDGPIEVNQLQLLQDGYEIRAGNTAKVDAVVLKATTRDVLVHGDISIRDVQLAIDARFGFAPDREVTLSDVRKALQALSLVSPPDAFADARIALAKLVGLQAATERAASVCKAAKTPAPDSDAAIACAFGQWLADNQYDATRLAKATNGLRSLLQAKDQWEALHPRLVVETGKTSVQNVASQALHYDQRTWLFTYLTPVVGYAFLQDSFSLFYLGLQLHFWPNPTNQPLWSHGVRDLRRAFAIEVGLSPQTGSFGPDDRYTGIQGIPPLFVGLALHPLPYTSVVVGRAFLERRATALAAEDPRWRNEWFLGVNVQVNIPDLVRQLSTPTASAYLQGQ